MRVGVCKRSCNEQKPSLQRSDGSSSLPVPVPMESSQEGRIKQQLLGMKPSCRWIDASRGLLARGHQSLLNPPTSSATFRLLSYPPPAAEFLSWRNNFKRYIRSKESERRHCFSLRPCRWSTLEQDSQYAVRRRAHNPELLCQVFGPSRPVRPRYSVLAGQQSRSFQRNPEVLVPCRKARASGGLRSWDVVILAR
jgi:hypothetical protein